MKLEDALIRAEMLRVRPEAAISPVELESAAHLIVVISSLWKHWSRLLAEFGVRLLHWGNRGNAALGDGRFLFIRLDTGQWNVQHNKGDGWRTIVGGWGLDALRQNLERQRPRPRRFGEQAKGVSADKSSESSSRGLARERGN